jgi:hypothetical protein
MAGSTSTSSATEAQPRHPSGQHAGSNAQKANERHGKKGPGRANREQRAADKGAQDLNPELHCLKDSLRPSLLPGLSHPAHLCVQAGKS